MAISRVDPDRRPRAWLETDLDALVHNARIIRRAIPAGVRMALTVKADGYGHGMIPAARAALAGGADRLIVVSIDEALALRAAGIGGAILVVYPVPGEAVAEAVDANVELSLSGVDSARRTLEAWSRTEGGANGRTLHVHVEVDTGMGRGGIEPAALLEVIVRLEATPGVHLAGIWSHLTDGDDRDRSAEQAARFDAALAAIAATGRRVPLRHLAATEAVFGETAPTYDMVRVGLGYYGAVGLDARPSPSMAGLAADLRPALALKVVPVRVERVPAGASMGYGREWAAERESVIATLPIGYADGWTRAYAPGASALVRGCRVPLVGRVSMDAITADVTDVPGVSVDDEFVLLGAQGDESITMLDLARLRGSIAHEVLVGFGPRLGRRVRGLGEPPSGAVGTGDRPG